MKGLLLNFFYKSGKLWGQRILAVEPQNLRGRSGAASAVFFSVGIPSCGRDWILGHKSKGREWFPSLPRSYRVTDFRSQASKTPGVVRGGPVG